MSPEDEFREAMARRGLLPPSSLVADGRIRRCATADKPGQKNGAYRLFLDERPRGGFEHHGDGRGWEKWSSSERRPMTPAEVAEWRARAHELAVESEKRRHAEAVDAARRAQSRWRTAIPCTSHPYLERKKVKSHGLRVLDGLLLIPIVIQGELASLQFVDDEGRKRFVSGGRKRGGSFTLGSPGRDPLCIAEGYATAASVFEATGWTTVVAFDCGNLLPVAEELRRRRPSARIVLCADDDRWTSTNPGVSHASQAARRVGGAMAVPTWTGDRGRGTDFNDLAAAEGLVSVRRCLSSATSALREVRSPRQEVVGRTALPARPSSQVCDDDGSADFSGRNSRNETPT